MGTCKMLASQAKCCILNTAVAHGQDSRGLVRWLLLMSFRTTLGAVLSGAQDGHGKESKAGEKRKEAQGSQKARKEDYAEAL